MRQFRIGRAADKMKLIGVCLIFLLRQIEFSRAGSGDESDELTDNQIVILSRVQRILDAIEENAIGGSDADYRPVLETLIEKLESVKDDEATTMEAVTQKVEAETVASNVTRTRPPRRPFPTRVRPNRPIRPSASRPTRPVRPPPPVRPVTTSTKAPTARPPAPVTEEVDEDDQFKLDRDQNEKESIDTVAILARIDDLQRTLVEMISDLQRPCVSNEEVTTTVPKVNPYLNLVQNTTAQQNERAQSIIGLWTKQIQSPSLRTPGNRATAEDIKLAGLQSAIVKVLEELVPKFKFIQEFSTDSATQKDWDELTAAIKFVSERLRNKTIAQVLGQENVQQMLDYYDKYLAAMEM